MTRWPSMQWYRKTTDENNKGINRFVLLLMLWSNMHGKNMTYARMMLVTRQLWLLVSHRLFFLSTFYTEVMLERDLRNQCLKCVANKTILLYGALRERGLLKHAELVRNQCFVTALISGSRCRRWPLGAWSGSWENFCCEVKTHKQKVTSLDFWHQGLMHKVLKYLKFKAVSF